MRPKNLLILAAVLVSMVVPFSASAGGPNPLSHGWASYHWPRSCATCAAVIKVYDSTTTTNTSWPTHLNRAIFGDASNPNSVNRRGWNDSAVLDLSIVAGGTSASTRSSCPAVTGAVRVCNYTYGSNGWLGLASINVVSGSSVHIAWGTAKMNDSYFNSGYPNTEKRHVMCQEVGHDFGLGHTSENGSSQNTCMDYYSNTSGTDWTSTGPNQHDFDQLLTQHHYVPRPALFAAAGIALPDDGRLEDPSQWGTAVEFDDRGRGVIFSRDLGLDAEGNQNTLLTHVYWADADAPTDDPDVVDVEHPHRQQR